MKTRPLLFAAAVGASMLAGEPVRATGPLSTLHAMRAMEMIYGLDLESARKELDAADLDDPNAAVERGRLALYEENCDGAILALARPDVLEKEDAAMLADIARGCARVTASTVMVKDDVNSIVVRLQDEADRALVPWIVETTIKARDQLTKDLKVDWPKPTRITVVRDLLSLSAMTGLPYDSARTTGTVAVAKWGRVTLLSPRASRHGFTWRDTLAHELTHLAVTRATADRAPLWLQEGVAKRQEIRWRAPGPFDERPPVDAVVLKGIELKLDIPLDKLGPSIAMLPSADAAMVAFAEVTSFVRFYATAGGEDALPKLFTELKNKKTVDESLGGGMTLAQWDAKWRAYLAGRPRESLSMLFGLGADPKAVLELRERVRLAELLMGRDHPPAAMREIDRAPRLGLEDPSSRYVRARTLEALKRDADARAEVASPKTVLASYGPWWAIRGRLFRAAGETADANEAFWEGLGADPFDSEVACQTLDPKEAPADPALAALCAAARAIGDPGLGRD
jgi:hypothetical protein